MVFFLQLMYLQLFWHVFTAQCYSTVVDLDAIFEVDEMKIYKNIFQFYKLKYLFSLENNVIFTRESIFISRPLETLKENLVQLKKYYIL